MKKTYSAHIECENDCLHASGLFGNTFSQYGDVYHFDTRKEAEDALATELRTWGASVSGYVHEHDRDDESGDSDQRFITRPATLTSFQ
jgi:hypothetical protein